MRDLMRILGLCALGTVLWLGCGTSGSGPCQSAEDCNDQNECTTGVCTDGVCSYRPLDDGTACSLGVCMAGECAPLRTVSGNVYVLDASGEEWVFAPGATVSVQETADSTTSGEYGIFEIEAPVGTVFLHVSMEGTWGSVVRVEVSKDDPTYADLDLIEDGFFTPMEEALGFELDETRGIVQGWYRYMTGSGGETLKLSESYGVALTLDSDDNWVLSAELQPQVFEPFLLFVGVDVTDALSVEPIAPEGKVCRLEHCTIDPGGFERCETLDPETVFPVIAKSFTGFWLECNWL